MFINHVLSIMSFHVFVSLVLSIMSVHVFVSHVLSIMSVHIFVRHVLSIMSVHVFISHPCQPMLELTEVANFGTLVANSRPAVKEIILTNTGAKKGDFNITYTGSKHITITPCSGTLPPHSEQKIKVFIVSVLSCQRVKLSVC